MYAERRALISTRECAVALQHSKQSKINEPEQARIVWPPNNLHEKKSVVSLQLLKIN